MDGDEFYEDPSFRVKRQENCYYQDNAVRLNCGSAQRNERSSDTVGTCAIQLPAPEDPSSGRKISKFSIGRWTIVFCFLIGITSLLIVITVHIKESGLGEHYNYTNTPGQSSSLGSSKAGSCNDLKKQGMNEDGIYEIQTDEEFFKFHTFCDMTTDGGGWTLVASIHENDIKAKCDSRDIWSTYGTRESVIRLGKETWENNVIFGDVKELSQADYKNRAYFQINASDIMIWHVPNGVHLDGLKKSARLRYRTTNSFLYKFGGNLQSLYLNHYPIKPFTESEYGEVMQNRTKTALEALVRRATAIKSHITDWHEYAYDNTHDGNRITGDPMYGSHGNQVRFYCPASTGNLIYGRYQKCDKSYVIGSAETHPFFAIGAFSNEDGKTSQYYIRVDMQRPTGTNNFTHTSNVLENGNYKLQYQLVQYSASGYNTVSEFYFVITNVKEWNSIEPSSFYRSGPTGTSTGTYKYSYVYAQGYPSRFVMGYVLLASVNGRIVGTGEADNVAKEILNEFSSLGSLFQGFVAEHNSLTVPVTFDKGSTSDVLNMIPPNYRSRVQAGFVQFRPFNMFGYPNAFCPGVKTYYDFPEYICVGGISKDKEDYGTCGDFTGWEGQKIGSATSPAAGTFHSHGDITTTIVIFYR